MRRILAVTAALLLLMSLLGPAVLADRGGRGGAPGNVPPVPVVGPGQEAQQERAQTQEQNQEQTQTRDQSGTTQDPPEEGDNDDEPAGPGPQHGLDTARAAIERAMERFQSGGAADPEDVDDGEDDADDSSEEGVSGRPTVPPGLVVAKGALDALANDEEPSEEDPSGEEASSDDTPQLMVRLRSTQADNDGDGGESGDEAESEEGEAGPPQGMFGRIWALQRVLQKRAMPFMMVGQPVLEGDSFTGVDLLRGNCLARDLADGASVEIVASTQVRLITAGGVQVCEKEAQECLDEWAALPGAYVQVWGHVELDAEGKAVFVAYRVTVTVPAAECGDCDGDGDANDDDGDIDDDDDNDEGDDD